MNYKPEYQRTSSYVATNSFNRKINSSERKSILYPIISIIVGSLIIVILYFTMKPKKSNSEDPSQKEKKQEQILKIRNIAMIVVAITSVLCAIFTFVINKKNKNASEEAKYWQTRNKMAGIDTEYVSDQYINAALPVSSGSSK